MKVLNLIPLLILVILFTGCGKPRDLTRPEVISLIQEVINDDSIRIHRLCFKAAPIDIDQAYGFSWKDRTFIERQNQIFSDFEFGDETLQGYVSQRKVFAPIPVDTFCHSGLLYHLSFPLISADRQRMVIQITEDCNCALGGGGEKRLYIKRNGHWKREKVFGRWVS